MRRRTRRGTEADFLALVFDNADLVLGGFVTAFYRESTHRDLSRTAVASFLGEVPAFKIFIAAHLHSLWVRSIKTKGPEKRSAGVIDTDSAAYLNFCDEFITNDHAQFELLTAANRFNPRVTSVSLYPDFRAQLLR